jgi:hypothetical protein
MEVLHSGRFSGPEWCAGCDCGWADDGLTDSLEGLTPSQVSWHSICYSCSTLAMRLFWWVIIRLWNLSLLLVPADQSYRWLEAVLSQPLRVRIPFTTHWFRYDDILSSICPPHAKLWLTLTFLSLCYWNSYLGKLVGTFYNKDGLPTKKLHLAEKEVRKAAHIEQQQKLDEEKL